MNDKYYRGRSAPNSCASIRTAEIILGGAALTLRSTDRDDSADARCHRSAKERGPRNPYVLHHADGDAQRLSSKSHLRAAARVRLGPRRAHATTCRCTEAWRAGCGTISCALCGSSRQQVRSELQEHKRRTNQRLAPSIVFPPLSCVEKCESIFDMGPFP